MAMKVLNILEKNKIGCCHVSVISNEFTTSPHWITNKEIKSYSQHFMKELKELDYIRKYIKYLPDIISIELENSFEEQLRIGKYLEKIIN